MLYSANEPAPLIPLCSRRVAVARLAHGAAAALAGVLAINRLVQGVDMLSHTGDQYAEMPEDAPKNQAAITSEISYPFTDCRSDLHGASVHNLGVRHTAEDLRLYGAHIACAIRECDILLLEGSPLRKFFDRLAEYGKAKGKDVQFVESELRLQTAELYSHAAFLVAQIGGIVNFEYALDSQAGVSTTKRAAALGFTGLGVFADVPSIPVIASHMTGLTEFLHYDPAPITAGRSVLMLEALYKAVQENSGKKILLVTGDLHAQYIQRLIEKGPDSQEYLMKLASYREILPS